MAEKKRYSTIGIFTIHIDTNTEGKASRLVDSIRKREVLDKLTSSIQRIVGKEFSICSVEIESQLDS